MRWEFEYGSRHVKKHSSLTSHPSRPPKPLLVLTHSVTLILQTDILRERSRAAAICMSHFPRCFVVVNVLLLLRHPATAFIPRADHHCSSELKHSGLKACQLHTAHVSWLYDFTYGSEPLVLQAQARDGNSDLDKCARALDLSAAAQGSTVEEVLQLAGVPSRNVARALEAFIGLQDCDPHAETLRRLHHLNFIIEQGVYSFEEAMELISTQSRFLEMNFSFVYKDGDLLVMNKPSDVRMDVPQRDGGERKWPTEFTCSDWLDIPGLVDPPLDKKRFCHNLDSATSGILCVARNQAAAARVVDLFAKRKVKKECTFVFHLSCLASLMHSIPPSAHTPIHTPNGQI